jgi:hypothetical protein
VGLYSIPDFVKVLFAGLDWGKVLAVLAIMINFVLSATNQLTIHFGD